MTLRNNRQAKFSWQKGLSLIELMISLLLGSVLTLGVVNLYSETKTNYFQDEQTYRMQEGARYALRMLSRELSMSGYPLGIIDTSVVTVNSVAGDCGVSGVDWALDPTVSLEHADKVTAAISATYSCITDTSILEMGSSGSDLLVVKRSADRETYNDGTLSANASLSDDKRYFRVASGGNDASIVLGSDIVPADILAGSGVDLWEYYSKIFVIMNYAIDADDGIPTLAVSNLGVAGMDFPDAYVEGVEKMNLEFGIDSDDDGVVDYFDPTPTAANIDDAIAVRIYLLMRSINPIGNYNNDKSYLLGSEAVAAKNDGFLRKVYSTTVKVRNRPGVG